MMTGVEHGAALLAWEPQRAMRRRVEGPAHGGPSGEGTDCRAVREHGSPRARAILGSQARPVGLSAGPRLRRRCRSPRTRVSSGRGPDGEARRTEGASRWARPSRFTSPIPIRRPTARSVYASLTRAERHARCRGFAVRGKGRGAATCGAGGSPPSDGRSGDDEPEPPPSRAVRRRLHWHHREGRYRRLRVRGRDLTRAQILAERVGFEPTGREGPAVFKTAPINHSGTSPRCASRA